MILTTQMLLEKYSNYANPRDKIAREMKSGRLFRLLRGVYETDPHANGAKLGQYIYGPSYLSFEYVLATNGLIPEAVYTYTFATFNKRKYKIYENHFGTFVYRDVPRRVFHLGVNTVQDCDYVYLVATPEKALCDKLYTIPPVRSVKDMKDLLFENLRIDDDDFYNLNLQDILQLAPLYKSTTLNVLVKFLEEKK